jgi:hypothetical protein
MKNLFCLSKTKLNNIEKKPFSGMAFDGEYFYTCFHKSSNIYMFNLEGDFIKSCNTERPYTSLCYDTVEKCFWAVSEENNEILYKLNLEFIIIEEIKILTEYLESINSISYNHNDDNLIITTYEGVYIVKKSGEIFYKYRNNKKNVTLTAGIILDEILRCNIYDPSSINMINIINIIYPMYNNEDIWCLPNGFMANSICTAYDDSGNIFLFILATKEFKESYILKYECLVENNVKSNEVEEEPMICIQEIDG